MIQLKNDRNEEQICSFFEKYGERLYGIFNDRNETIRFPRPEWKSWGFVIGPDDYMCTLSNVIAINLDNCMALKLTEDELHAMMAHEIGHIFIKDKYNSTNNSAEKEFEADKMAVILGLGEAMASALEKLLLKVDDENLRTDIRRRIVILREKQIR